MNGQRYGIYTQRNISHKKKNEILLFAVAVGGFRGCYAKWNKTKKDKYRMTSFTCGI